jgi:hypothetical protein
MRFIKLKRTLFYIGFPLLLKSGKSRPGDLTRLMAEWASGVTDAWSGFATPARAAGALLAKVCAAFHSIAHRKRAG